MILSDWYQKKLGQYINMHERKQLETLLPQFQGLYLLQLGCVNQTEWLNTSSIFHKIIVGNDFYNSSTISLIASSYTKLPFPNETIDLVILPHTLETEELEAKATLAEALRVLTPNGHVVILGFNPWSLWGLLCNFSALQNYFPRLNHLYSMQKIRHWLFSEDANIILEKTFCYDLPLKGRSQPTSLLEKVGPLLLPSVGNLYIMVAKKQVIPLKPIKTDWNLETIFRSKNLGEPTVGRVRRG